MSFSIGRLRILSVIAILCVTGAATIPPRIDARDPALAAGIVTTAPFEDLEPLAPPPEPKEKKPETKPAADEPEETAPTSDATKAAERTEPSEQPGSQPAKEETDIAHVEVYVPSVVKLAKGFEDSKTSDLVEIVSALVPEREETIDEEQFDFAAVQKLLEHVLSWPDTSLTFTTYAQDRDGRPRWALRVDWPVGDFVERLKTVLADESARKVLEDVRLVAGDDNAWRLELPDMVLAHLRPQDGGSMLAATADLRPTAEVFGVDEAADKKGRSRSTLLFCRLNLDAQEDGARNAAFSALVGVSTVDYELRLLKNGTWREMFVVKWNAMVGMAAKAIFRKTKNRFDCPDGAYFNAVFNLGSMTEAAADGIAGFSPGTIGARTTGDMALSVVPGTGFLPFPDTYYQFRTGRRHIMIEKIREVIADDTETRRKDDRRQAWHEEEVDGDIVFWRDPTADGAYGLAPATFRTVVFFHPPLSEDEKTGAHDRDKDDAASQPVGDDEDGPDRMVVIASTSTWADDAVRNYREQVKETRRLPSSKKIDWQAVIAWKRAYALAHPYVSLLTGLADGAAMPPEPGELTGVLADSRVDVKIGVSGFYARHIGPVPIGAIYVPAVSAMTLSASADASSEIAREQIACRRLRVLHHHAKLFKEDYGRWPATVAELDGYVDFASHPQLLRLREKKLGMLKGFVSMFSIDKSSGETQRELDDDEIDDTLYEIDWSENEADWKLKFRRGEFVSYETIYIDAEGEIHRVPKSEGPELARGMDEETTEQTETPKL